MQTNKSLTSFILLALEKAVDGYIRFEDFAYNPHIYARGYDRSLKKSALSQAFKRLREMGLIDFVDDQQLIYRLTDKGLDKALWTKLILDKEKWDGKWRLVIFDIPEKRRTVREVLRARLKELGFKRWQQSLWVSKKNCTKQLRDFIKRVGIERWVIVVESDNISS